ncbi:MAG: hypothetical protein CVT49_05705 [candidate division Zixibacteria bacterium HGW-Zixibacteria-1]|nr:MAG: hypothetical protein CVT49_05705 [candidate division Zixibacteria bacterium HGW-Zixibacteria-1]
MPKQEMGLMGYVGESVVEQWLKKKYSSPKYTIVRQIMPTAVPKTGGPYLDFAIIKNDKTVEAIYEVKSQHFISGATMKINKSLTHCWIKKGRKLRFQTQDGNIYHGRISTNVFLVLLVVPNEGGRSVIGRANLKYILLFEDIWRELGKSFRKTTILKQIKEDASIVIDILKAPHKGLHHHDLLMEHRDIVKKRKKASRNNK